jgi:hypothetical protein
VLSGEENIMNDESPHKCHSIKTYAISTFFNASSHQPIIKYITVNENNNEVKVHGLPKINFNMPESKLVDLNNISYYETPISLTGPYNIDASNPDISLLTNSCLNLSNNQADLNIDFG